MVLGEVVVPGIGTAELPGAVLVLGEVVVPGIGTAVPGLTPDCPGNGGGLPGLIPPGDPGRGCPGLPGKGVRAGLRGS